MLVIKATPILIKNFTALLSNAVNPRISYKAAAIIIATIICTTTKVQFPLNPKKSSIEPYQVLVSIKSANLPSLPPTWVTINSPSTLFIVYFSAPTNPLIKLIIKKLIKTKL